MIRVHYLENVPWDREHLSYFKRFTKYLQTKFTIEVKTYKPEETLDLCVDIPPFDKPKISDVDFVIENTELKKIKIFSFTEYFLHFLIHWSKSEHVDSIHLGHFSYHWLYNWCKSDNNLHNIHKIKPFTFLSYAPFDPTPYRNKRENDKLFYLGSGVNSYRETVKIVNEKGYLQPLVNVDHKNYLELLSKQKIALSHYLDLSKNVNHYEHTGEFCYRDIEMMALGIPFVRMEFRDTTYDPMLPNIHYIPILREDCFLAYERNGNEGVADLYIKKYLEVKDDEDYLSYISNNQIEWYDRNNKSPESEQQAYKLLNLKEWE